MYESMAVVAAFALGVLWGWFLRRGEVLALRDALERQHALLRQAWAEAEKALVSHLDERERLLQTILDMRREGYQAIDDTPLGGWVLDDAHEAEVSERRQNQGISRAETAEFREMIEEGINAKPLRE